MKLLQALRNATQKIAFDIKDSNLFDHPGDRGEFRERIVEHFLRPFLPPCYGIGSGQVFSIDGGASRQIDLVIYDSVFSNVLFRNQANSLFPAESVYGTIEVKSHLSGDELDVSIGNVGSVKCLDREPSDMLDILPFRRLKVGPGLSHSNHKRNPYLGIVFAYDGISVEAVARRLNDGIDELTADEKECLPNFIFSYKQGYTLLRTVRSDGGDTPAPFAGGFDRYNYMMTGDDTLPLFFLTINLCLNGIILKAPNFNDYWVQVANAATGE